MAPGGDSNNNLSSVLEKMLSHFLYREEVNNVPRFSRNGDIEKHVQIIKEKIEFLKLSGEDKLKFLQSSLHDDVLSELKTIPQYKEKCKNYDGFLTFLLENFKLKKSAISNLLELFELKQSSSQTTRDFLSIIRIEGNKLIFDKSDEEREVLLIQAFINGLYNRKVADAVKHLEPKTLSAAYEFVKNEKNDSVNENFRLINNAPNETHLLSVIAKMQAEINYLKNQMSHILGQKIMPSPRADLKQNSFNQNKNLKNSILCYKCNEEGHMARECRNKAFCPRCKQKGHALRDCFRNKKVRNFNCTSDSVSQPETADLIDEHQKVDDFPVLERDINMINFKKQKNDYKVQCPKNNIKTYNSKLKYDDSIVQWANYIEGHSKKPEKPFYSLSSQSKATFDGKTLISKHHKEKAANKPIVKCRIYGSTSPVLFDSGAEINVIDKNFLCNLMEKNKNIKFFKCDGVLNCANGSTMKILGYTGITVNIGVKAILFKFTVVNEIFPKVVIGLPAMKKHSIDILPSADAIKVCGIQVPFISTSKISKN